MEEIPEDKIITVELTAREAAFAAICVTGVTLIGGPKAILGEVEEDPEIRIKDMLTSASIVEKLNIALGNPKGSESWDDTIQQVKMILVDEQIKKISGI